MDLGRKPWTKPDFSSIWPFDFVLTYIFHCFFLLFSFCILISQICTANSISIRQCLLHLSQGLAYHADSRGSIEKYQTAKPENRSSYLRDWHTVQRWETIIKQQVHTIFLVSLYIHYILCSSVSVHWRHNIQSLAHYLKCEY